MDLDNFFGILGTILGMVGIVTGYVFYRKGLQKKEPMWDVRSNNIIRNFSSKLSDLKILYKEKEIHNLTISRVIFWNEGGDTIDKNDIDTINHLRVEVADNIEILDIEILGTSNPSSQCRIALSEKKKGVIHFDYLDRGQWIVIQVIHTGISSKDIMIAGDVKGAPAIQKTRIYYVTRTAFMASGLGKGLKPSTARKVVYYQGLALLMLIFIGAMGMSYTFYNQNRFWEIILVSLFAILLSLLLLSQLRRVSRTITLVGMNDAIDSLWEK
jgi:hypothetical protein